MNESEILIAIKTALESGGIDAAKAKIAELTSETEKNSAANVGNASENRKTIATLGNLQSAANGNITALARLTGQTGQLGAALMQAGAVASSFMIGWQAGLKLGDWMWPKIMKLDEFDKTTGSIRDGIRQTIQNIQDLDKQKMHELMEELANIDAGFQKLDRTTSLEQRRDQRLLDAQQRAERAQLEEGFAGKERGPEYERQKAEMERRHAEEQSSLKTDQLQRQEENLRKNLTEIHNEVEKARKEKNEAIAHAEKLDQAGGTSKKEIQERLIAQEEAKKAQERFDQLQEEAAKRRDDIAAKRFEIDTERMVTSAGKEEVGSRFRGAMISASATESKQQADREAAHQAEQLRMKEQGIIAKRDQMQEQLRAAQEEARRAKEAASSFTPRGGGKAFAGALAKDMALDEVAAQKDQAVGEVKGIIEDFNEQLKAVRQQMRSQNKGMIT